MAGARMATTAESSHGLALVVLAAGRGHRIAAQGHSDPKWLLPIAGRLIAEYQLDGIAAAARDEDRLVLVTGYGEEALTRWLAERELPTHLDVVRNRHWSDRNNWFSLLLAVEHLAEIGWQGSLVVINSDLCARPQLFTAFLDLVRSTPPGRPVLAVDFERPLSDEAMKVAGATEDSGEFRCSGIGKTGVGSAAGEYIGLAAFAAPDWSSLIPALENFKSPEHHDEWYEAIFQDLMDRDGPFAAWPTAGFEWTEVDDAEDWKRAVDVMSRS